MVCLRERRFTFLNLCKVVSILEQENREMDKLGGKGEDMVPCRAERNNISGA